jgi:hypothetical protein
MPKTAGMPSSAEVPALHVIYAPERRKDSVRIKPIDRSKEIWSTGYWIVSEKTEQILLNGGKVYLHSSKAAPSRFGGSIIRFVRETAGQWKGKVSIHFIRQDNCKGVTTPRTGWTQERKLVTG